MKSVVLRWLQGIALITSFALGFSKEFNEWISFVCVCIGGGLVGNFIRRAADLDGIVKEETDKYFTKVFGDGKHNG